MIVDACCAQLWLLQHAVPNYYCCSMLCPTMIVTACCSQLWLLQHAMPNYYCCSMLCPTIIVAACCAQLLLMQHSVPNYDCCSMLCPTIIVAACCAHLWLLQHAVKTINVAACCGHHAGELDQSAARVSGAEHRGGSRRQGEGTNKSHCENNFYKNNVWSIKGKVSRDFIPPPIFSR